MYVKSYTNIRKHFLMILAVKQINNLVTNLKRKLFEKKKKTVAHRMDCVSFLRGFDLNVN